jgi:large subunit ribosomal protein L9
MKVILNQTVPKVGKAGTVVTVADGFARNYLFPRKLAILADKKQVDALGKRLERVAALTAGEKAAAETLREKLHHAEVRIPGKVGKDSGKLFGAITSQDIVDAVKAEHGVVLEKKQVALIDPIKKLGTHHVELDLHLSVSADLLVTVYDPNAPVAKAAASAEAEPEEELVEA